MRPRTDVYDTLAENPQAHPPFASSKLDGEYLCWEPIVPAGYRTNIPIAPTATLMIRRITIYKKDWLRCNETITVITTASLLLPENLAAAPGKPSNRNALPVRLHRPDSRSSATLQTADVPCSALDPRHTAPPYGRRLDASTGPRATYLRRQPADERPVLRQRQAGLTPAHYNRP